jgi:hypothetical protein
MAGKNQGVSQFWLFRNPHAEEERGEHDPVIMMMRAGFMMTRAGFMMMRGGFMIIRAGFLVLPLPSDHGNAGCRLTTGSVPGEAHRCHGVLPPPHKPVLAFLC